MITIRGNRAKSTGKCWKDTVKENVITTWQENVITTRIKGAKSVGTWRKPERLLGTNYDDAVNMLEKYSESAGKCDNNQRKYCKNDRKLKETGKTLGKIRPHRRCWGVIFRMALVKGYRFTWGGHFSAKTSCF